MKLRFLLLYLITLLVFSGVFLPFKSTLASANDIATSTVPANPAPDEETTITLSSYTYNLDSVLIIWLLNGKESSRGVGQKAFSVNAPVSGEESTIVARIDLPDGLVDKQVTIRPSTIIMLWQAEDSYVPPFYRGKAMPTTDSKIKVVAMPEIKVGSKMADANNMVYSWKQDYTNMPEANGYGKNYFTYIADYLENSSDIGVTATTTDGIYSSEAIINIRTILPKILFYKNDPSMGTLFEQALSDGYKIVGDEIIEGAPYFISPKNIINPNLAFNWFINDLQIAVPAWKKNLLPLTIQSGVSGTAKIRLEVNNNSKIFETANKEINVAF